jgi:hypothetical protein
VLFFASASRRGFFMRRTGGIILKVGTITLDRVETRRVGFGLGPGPGAIEGVVDDLKLSGKKKDQAMAAAKAHQEKVRKLMDQARAQLLQKMKEILSEEEFKDFTAALDRPRGGTFIVGPPGPR